MKESKLFRRNLVFTLLLTFVFVFTSCEKEPVSQDLNAVDVNANASPAAQQGDQTIAEIVISSAEEGEFTYLLQALVVTDLAGVFTDTDNYTVFAPTDDAFRAVLGEDPDWENIDKDFLTNVLLYHVTDGRRFSNSVLGKKNWKNVEMLNEGIIYVNADGEIDTNDEDMDPDSTIIKADLPATNGVIHVINAVLVPAE